MTRDYSHPYEPYKIQNELMDAIYETVNNGFKVGLFESPTGTGKTLSIICSTMTWLRDFKQENDTNIAYKGNALDSSNESSDDEPDWVKAAHRKSILSRTKGRAIDYEKHLQGLKDQVLDFTELEGRNNLKKKKESIEYDTFVPNDYHSDSEGNLIAVKNSRLSAENTAIMKRLSGDDVESLYPPECPHTILFSSRTHSQLYQFVHQLQLPSFHSSLEEITEYTKFVALGSRKQLCINDKVRLLGNLNSINDAGVDLQKKDQPCDFFPKVTKSGVLEKTKSFIDNCFVKVNDIEDVALLGKKLEICPYYTVRNATDYAEIIALPYQLLLLKSARESLDLKIENSIVVIDEAHNLIDTISSMNSVTLSLSELTMCINGLKLYLSKFARRLNSGNRIYLVKLIKLCQVVQKFMTKTLSYKSGDKVDPLEIFQGNTGDLINVNKLNKYLSKSKIAYKIESYLEHVDDQISKQSSSNPILFKVVQFLECLTNTSNEGEIIWDMQEENVTLQYILLDPSIIFEDVLSQAKCVLLCGGTMEPMDDFKSYLFPNIPSNLVKTFTCDHLIPKENLKVFAVKATNNLDFEFSFQKRSQPSMMRELGLLIARLCQSIPSGVVIFFPSYKYLAHVFSLWSSSGILERISSSKTVFQEPKNSQEVESTLQEYSSAVKSSFKGAALFAVVGGKMAEGINFADDLARGVIVVGLPYPNAAATDLVAKQNHIVRTLVAKGKSQSEAANASRDYYENICMRAVNQSIGRSIRHANDYSTIFLIDQRYSRKNIRQKLSKWVRNQLSDSDQNIDEIIYSTEKFFEYHRYTVNK